MTVTSTGDRRRIAEQPVRVAAVVARVGPGAAQRRGAGPARGAQIADQGGVEGVPRRDAASPPPVTVRRCHRASPASSSCGTIGRGPTGTPSRRTMLTRSSTAACRPGDRPHPGKRAGDPLARPDGDHHGRHPAIAREHPPTAAHAPHEAVDAGEHDGPGESRRAQRGGHLHRDRPPAVDGQLRRAPGRPERVVVQLAAGRSSPAPAPAARWAASGRRDRPAPRCASGRRAPRAPVAGPPTWTAAGPSSAGGGSRSPPRRAAAPRCRRPTRRPDPSAHRSQGAGRRGCPRRSGRPS